ncbi:hypothetical protein Tco_0919508 [Tanacetum coccineum]
MVPNEEDKVERFVRGLPNNIQGNVIAAEPTKLQDAIRIANNLMDQKLKGYARSAKNKRRLDNNPRDNQGQQPVFKRQNVGGQNVYTFWNNEKKGYVGSLLYCVLSYLGLRFGHCVLVIEGVVLEDLTAFCFKTSLRFASRPHCVLLQDLTAFCFKTYCVCFQDFTAFCFIQDLIAFLLQGIIAFCFKLSCVLPSTHCSLLKTPLLFCLKTILRFDKKLLWQNFISSLRLLQRSFELETTRDATRNYLREMSVPPMHWLQGLPKDIYSSFIHKIKAKKILGHVKMLLAGSELTKMIENPQLFMIAVKLNKGLKETNHEQLYAYLKQHEKHAAQDRLIIERITPVTNDQLAFLSTVQPHAQSSHVQSHQYPSLSTNPQSPQYPQFPETSQIDSRYTSYYEILDKPKPTNGAPGPFLRETLLRPTINLKPHLSPGIGKY